MSIKDNFLIFTNFLSFSTTLRRGDVFRGTVIIFTKIFSQRISVDHFF
jgi:hypothetical protein